MGVKPEEIKDMKRTTQSASALTKGALRSAEKNLDRLVEINEMLFAIVEEQLTIEASLSEENAKIKAEYDSLKTDDERLQYLYKLQTTNRDFFARMARSQHYKEAIEVINRDPEMREYWKLIAETDDRANKAEKANVNAQKLLDKKDGQIDNLNKSNKVKNVVIGVTGGLLMLASIGWIGHEVHHHTRVSTTENVIELDYSALQGKLSDQQKMIIDLGDSVVILTTASLDAADASKQALAVEDMENFTVKDAYDRASEAYDFAATTLDKVNVTLDAVKADQVAVLAEDNFDTLLGYMDKNNGYISSMAEYILDAGRVVGEARTTLETANVVAKADLQAEIDELEATVATVTAERDELAAINETLNNEIASWKAQIAGTFDYTFGDYTYSDFALDEDYNVISFGTLDETLASIPLNEAGVEAVTADANAEVKSEHFDTAEQLQMLKGMGAVYKAASEAQDEDTHTQGGENGGQNTEVADENDEGQSPNEGTEPGSGIPGNPNGGNGDEQENGDENTTTGTEISDGGEHEPGEDDQTTFGNGGDNN